MYIYCLSFFVLKFANEKRIRFQRSSKKNEKLIRFSFANFKTKKEKTVYTDQSDRKWTINTCRPEVGC